LRSEPWVSLGTNRQAPDNGASGTPFSDELRFASAGLLESSWLAMISS